MKRMAYLVVVSLITFIFIPIRSISAQTSVKKPLPQVPITYSGDTDETIMRRGKWIEEVKREGELVWWGILRPEEAKNVIAGFNRVYPFIKVVYWRGRGEEIAAKLEAEYAGKRYSVDVMLGGEPYNYPRWAKKGMLGKFTDIIPEIEKFDKRRYSKRGDWIQPGLAPKIPQYNTKLVSAAEVPKTWEDFLDPKWRGQLGCEMESENWATLALSEGGWGIEKTENFLTKLKEQKPRFIQGGSATHSLLIAGEFKMSVMGNLRHVILSQEKKAPVDWVRISPILTTGPSFSFSNKAPHPNAARLFLEWLFSPSGLSVWADVSANYVPGIWTPMAKLLEGMPLLIRTEEAELKVVELDLVKKFNKLLFGIED